MIHQYEAYISIFIVILGVITYKGLTDEKFQEHYFFDIDRILIDKQYFRLISSGFLHGDWFHFAFNAIAISAFGVFAFFSFGIWNTTVLYFGSLLSGSMLSLYIHRNHGDYTALGASGAGFGLMFSSIVFSPTSNLTFVLVPINVPSWLMGSILIAISIIGIKKNIGRIGHDAHLGGAIFGILFTAITLPSTLVTNWWIYLLLGLPCIVFVGLILYRPDYLLVDEVSVKAFIDTPTFRITKNKQEELDELLDKINTKGIHRLSKKEKERLNDLSNR